MIAGLVGNGLYVIQSRLNFVFLTTAMSSSLYYLIVATILSSYLQDLASRSP